MMYLRYAIKREDKISIAKVIKVHLGERGNDGS